MDTTPPQNQNNLQPTKLDLKKQRFEEALQREKRKKFLWIGGSVAGVVALVGLIGYYATRPQEPLPGISYPNQGQDHVPLDHQDTYNSNPPTSGPHYASPANWGVYDYEVPDKIFIHNLEHGGIWISYKSSVGKDVVGALNDMVKKFGGSKLVMAPRAADDTDIAIAAWGHLLKFNLSGGILSDQQKKDIENFYLRLKDRGPENVPDFMAGVDPKNIK